MITPFRNRLNAAARADPQQRETPLEPVNCDRPSPPQQREPLWNRLNVAARADPTRTRTRESRVQTLSIWNFELSLPSRAASLIDQPISFSSRTPLSEPVIVTARADTPEPPSPWRYRLYIRASTRNFELRLPNRAARPIEWSAPFLLPEPRPEHLPPVPRRTRSIERTRPTTAMSRC